MGEIKILEAEDKANVNLMVTSENRENIPNNQCKLPVFLLFTELLRSSGVQQNKPSVSEMICESRSLARKTLLRGGTSDDLPACLPLELCSLHHWDT